MSFFKSLGRAIKRVIKSPVGAVIGVAAAAYVGVPAVSRAIGAFDKGGSLSDVFGAFGDGAMEQFQKIGGTVGLGGAEMQTGPGGGDFRSAGVPQDAGPGDGISNSGAPVRLQEQGIMGSILDFVKSPGGGALTSAALKLAGGALSPNETAMQIEAKDRWRAEDQATLARNTNVANINFNKMPGVVPRAPFAVPPAPVAPAAPKPPGVL